jgi:hypothetical protein
MPTNRQILQKSRCMVGAIGISRIDGSLVKNGIFSQTRQGAVAQLLMTAMFNKDFAK